MAYFEHHSDYKCPTDQSAGRNVVASPKAIRPTICSKSMADSLASTRISAILASPTLDVILRWPKTVILTEADHLAECVPYLVVCFLLASKAVWQCWHHSYCLHQTRSIGPMLKSLADYCCHYWYHSLLARTHLSQIRPLLLFDRRRRRCPTRQCLLRNMKWIKKRKTHSIFLDQDNIFASIIFLTFFYDNQLLRTVVGTRLLSRIHMSEALTASSDVVLVSPLQNE